MVCCLTIAAVLGFLFRPIFGTRSNPLAWRPGIASPGSMGRLRSFSHAFAGLGFLVRNEPNMRIHLAAAAAVIGTGVWLEIDSSEWRWLVVAMAIVMTAEALNTGVEQACNAVTRTHRPEIKAAKDAAAASVLVAAFAATLIGASVFAPHLVNSVGASTSICGEVQLGGR